VVFLEPHTAHVCDSWFQRKRLLSARQEVNKIIAATVTKARCIYVVIRLSSVLSTKEDIHFCVPLDFDLDSLLDSTLLTPALVWHIKYLVSMDHNVQIIYSRF